MLFVKAVVSDNKLRQLLQFLWNLLCFYSQGDACMTARTNRGLKRRRNSCKTAPHSFNAVILSNLPIKLYTWASNMVFQQFLHFSTIYGSLNRYLVQGHVIPSLSK